MGVIPAAINSGAINNTPPSNQSAGAFDPRIVEVDLDLPGGTQTFSAPAAIWAFGEKYGSALQSTCTCTIFNLTPALRNQILTQLSPLNPTKQAISMTLKVGRQSYGTAILFVGSVISCDVSQPPDIGITLRALTNNYFNGMILNFQQPAMSLLSVICAQVANAMGLKLVFQASDRQIANNVLSGSVGQAAIKKLNDMGGVHAWSDGTTLTVLNTNTPLAGGPFVLNESSGMVGIPQVTEQGVRVKMMYSNQIFLGASVTIESVINPATNGTYKIMKIGYEVATRDDPFYLTLETSKYLAVFTGSE